MYALYVPQVPLTSPFSSVESAMCLPSASGGSSSPTPPSSSSSPHLQKILALKPHEIRWFYEEPGKAWTLFNGHDSLCLEDCHQRLQTNRNSSEGCEVSVMGDMYKANVQDKMCQPIYWTGIMYIIQWNPPKSGTFWTE